MPSLSPPTFSFPHVYPSAPFSGKEFLYQLPFLQPGLCPLPVLVSLTAPSALAYLIWSLSNVLMPSDHISLHPSSCPHLCLHPKLTSRLSSFSGPSGPRESGLCHCCAFRPHIPPSTPVFTPKDLSPRCGACSAFPTGDSSYGLCFSPNASASDRLLSAAVVHMWRIPLTLPFSHRGKQTSASLCLSPPKGGCAPHPQLHLLRHEQAISQKAHHGSWGAARPLLPLTVGQF